MHRTDGEDHRIAYLAGHDLLRLLVKRASGKGDVILHLTVLGIEEALPLLDHLSEGVSLLALLDADDRLSLAGDGIAERTGIDVSDVEISLPDGVLEEAEKHLHGITTTEIDVHTGVATLETGEGELVGDGTLLRLLLLIAERCGDVHATGAADEDLAHHLGVEIDEVLALDVSSDQLVCADHTLLLVDGEDRLDGAVLQRIILEDCQRDRITDTVISTEGGVASGDPLAVDVGIDRVLLEVVIRLGGLLRHHVHMGLEGHHRVILVPLGGGLVDEDVARLSAAGLETELLTDAGDVLRDRLAVVGGTGVLGEGVEVLPDQFGLQILDFLRHRIWVLVFDSLKGTKNSPTCGRSAASARRAGSSTAR